jgi:uncharacterized protein YaaN involved in tellurite resistance
MDAMVAALVGDVSRLDIHSPAYRRRIGDVEHMADREIVAMAEMSAHLLDRSASAMHGLGDGEAPVAKTLLELRRCVEELNPRSHDLAHAGPRKLLGVIPLRDRVDAYFAHYDRAQERMQGLVAALWEGAAGLARENAALAQEEEALWSEIEALREYSYMAGRLEAALLERIESLREPDPGRARTLTDEVLFSVRQRGRRS